MVKKALSRIKKWTNPIHALQKLAATMDKDWLKQLIMTVLDKRRVLEEEELISIFQTFLIDEGLLEGGSIEEIEVVNDKETIQEDLASKVVDIKKMIINSISDVEGVNALVSKQEITFNDKLTVIFGNNASGKSGYVRVFKRASNSRTCEDIWGNIHKEKTKNTCKAKIVLQLNGKSKTIAWNGGRELYPITMVDVFDNKCVKVFLTDKLGFAFKPYGFELFDVISDGISVLKEMLDKKIQEASCSKEFLDKFTVGTSVYNEISKLSSATDINNVENLLLFSEDDNKVLKEKEQQKKNLDVSDLKIKSLQMEKRLIGEVKHIIDNASTFFANGKLRDYEETITKYYKAKEEIAKEMELSKTGLSKIDFNDSEEWRGFLENAEKYIKLLPSHEHYPEKNDKCVYCWQTLDKNAKELIKSYRKLLSSNESSRLDDIEKNINKTIRDIENADFSFPEYPEEEKNIAESILSMVRNGFGSEVIEYCSKTADLKVRIVDILRNKKTEKIAFITNSEFIDLLSLEEDKREKEIVSLIGDEKERVEKVEKIVREINELTDAKTLSSVKADVIEYVKQLKWVNKAKEVNRAITTRPITEISKKVWDELVTDDFKESFEKERSLLKAPVIDFSFPGEHGETKRKKTIEGFGNIDDFLSEGEQKAIALADFIAELSIKKESTPVIFDDPVTSFDHTRRRTIANRLFELSQERQVIIFTHDILFLFFLTQCCEDDSSCYFSHWTESYDSLFGKVSLYDVPLADNYENSISKVEKCIDRAPTLSGSDKMEIIRKGFAKLRSSCENLVIEKAFKKVIMRFDERIRMGRLKDIKCSPDILKKIQDKHEELSKYIEAHSHSGTMSQKLPDVEDLKTELGNVKALRKEVP